MYHQDDCYRDAVPASEYDEAGGENGYHGDDEEDSEEYG